MPKGCLICQDTPCTRPFCVRRFKVTCCDCCPANLVCDPELEQGGKKCLEYGERIEWIINEFKGNK